ncbi:MAG TPA: hypothetical protein VJC07_04555 [Candidatus Nanoarchaeia archaeon]|nr:hypothetical protein [Candidatus Nanoarchaeia archaeon]
MTIKYESHKKCPKCGCEVYRYIPLGYGKFIVCVLCNHVYG